MVLMTFGVRECAGSGVFSAQASASRDRTCVHVMGEPSWLDDKNPAHRQTSRTHGTERVTGDWKERGKHANPWHKALVPGPGAQTRNDARRHTDTRRSANGDSGGNRTGRPAKTPEREKVRAEFAKKCIRKPLVLQPIMSRMPDAGCRMPDAHSMCEKSLIGKGEGRIGTGE